MAFLSLSRGDPAARELLQRAIRARYGLRPPALESRRLQMTARGKGPLGLPVTILISTSYALPKYWRWDQTRKLFGLSLGKMSLSFDGSNWYECVKDKVTVTDDPRTLEGARQRLWAEVAFTLAPLTMPGIMLKSVDDTSFQVMRDNEPEIAALVRLDSSDAITVETSYYEPAEKQLTHFKLASQGGLQTLYGFVVPKQIAYQWGEKSPEIYQVVKAEANPTILPNHYVLS